MSDSESRRRSTALAILGLMMIIFIVLSAFSFLGSRGQVVPYQVSFEGHGAVDGKRVFQAYNCMGCHTMVGNGAYFAPDLTGIYRRAGPAWLSAFLPSPGSWPTAVAVSAQLQDSAIAAVAKVTTLDAYYQKYPGARDRVERRGGERSDMPNLTFTKDQVDALIAYLKYTSEMNTEGWPPKPLVNGLTNSRATPGPAAAASAAVGAAGAPSSAAAAAASADPAAQGEQLATSFGCVACHSPTSQRIVGPGWGGLYDSKVKLSDGSTVEANDAYLDESIRDPNAKIVAGFPANVMPNYGKLLTEAQRTTIIAYIRSLGAK
jgi:mono/diheme cytochrome c family protein